MSHSCWSEYGLTSKGGQLAEARIAKIEDLLQGLTPPVAEALLKEASFRVFELPKRSPSFQEKYRAQEVKS